MGQLFANAARTTLATAISAADTSITLALGDSFPVANTGSNAISDAKDWFKVVLDDGSNIEIVYVRTHTSNSETFVDVLRGQDGTTARNWSAGVVVGLRMTAQDVAACLPAHHLSVYLSGSAYSPNNTWAKVAVNAVAHDTAGIWNTANGRAVPKRAGYYLINVRVRTDYSGVLVAGIGKNGVLLHAVGPDGGSSFYGTGGAMLVYCNGTTDYIELWAFSNSSRTLTPGTIDTYLQLSGPL